MNKLVNFDYMEDDVKTSKSLVDEGKCLNYGPLSICKIKRIVGNSYQVDCFHPVARYTNLFEDFEPAFNKFQEIKVKLNKEGYRFK